MRNLNPMVLEQRCEPRLIPRYILHACLEYIAVTLELAVGKCNVKGILFGSKTARPVPAAVRRVIDSAEVLAPRVVPVALAVLNEIV